jgi:hypothetical protein
MQILPPKSPEKKTPLSAKRRSVQTDFSSLAPLTTTGTVGFTAFRDPTTEASARKTKRKSGVPPTIGSIEGDSDDDDDDEARPSIKTEEKEGDDEDDKAKVLLSIEDARRQGELAEGVRKIKVSKELPGSLTNRRIY